MDIITDIIHRYSLIKPDQLALIWVNCKGEVTRKINYKQTSELINQISAFLSEKTSLQSHDKVALLFHNGMDFILTFLACIQLGIIPIPLKYPSNKKKFSNLLPILNECKPRYIINSLPFNISDICSIPWIKLCEQYPKTSFQKPSNYSNIAFLQFTSGSISEPKGVMISHENLLHNLQLMTFYLVKNQTVPIIASWLPHYHDMGLIGAYLANLYHGGTGYYMAPTTFMTNPNAFIQLISDIKATFIQCPNSAYEFMCREWDHRDVNLSSLINVINASEPIHISTLEKFYATFKNVGLRRDALKPTYGLAEATLFVAQANTSYWISYQNHIACGFCPDIDIKIINPDTHMMCAEGVEGEIWLHSKSNAIGYYNKVDLTEEIFNAKIHDQNQLFSKKNYLRTGDLGFFHDHQLYVTGRIKDVIIINGINIYPHDIEYTVEQFPGIQPHGCVAIAWEDNLTTKIVILSEVKSENHIPDINDLIRFILDHHDIPIFNLVLCSRFSLPKTTSGKLKRLSSKKLYEENKILPLKQIINGKFEINNFIMNDQINHHKTLYELGVDSLKMTHLHFQLSKNISDKYVNELSISKLYNMKLLDYISIINEQSKKEQEKLILNWVERLKNKSKIFYNKIKQDAKLDFTFDKNSKFPCQKKYIKNVFLTGSTGFIGAYFCYYLLKITDYHLHLLVNEQNESSGLSRVLNNLENYQLLQKCYSENLENRITIICGDLSKENLNLTEGSWNELTHKIDCIYHCGAITHYLMPYEDLKATNIDGTRTIIKLAKTERLKYIHYISTTLIFGWTPIKLLTEEMKNKSFKYLDFGYAESKWVAEQLIWQSQRYGVPIQIYRPAMVTASSERQYTEKDIVARSLTYLLNHQVAIDMPNQISFIPVDEVAHDIIAISLLENPKHLAYHLTAEYSNLPMICRYLTEKYQYKFKYMSLSDFNQHLQDNASEKDIIFPLVSFFNAHYKKINKMQNKRYCRKNYLEVLQKINKPMKTYSLENTLDFIVQFLQKNVL